MHPTSGQAGPDLAIELADRKEYYIPGDTISGAIVRKSSLHYPEVKVCISLFGRSSCTRADRWSVAEAAAVYTDECRLIDNEKHTKVLFQGPFYRASLPGIERKWEFTIEIPESVDPKLYIGDPEAIFTKDNMETPLPPTFHRIALVDSLEALVEYFLKANLMETPSKTVTAIFPLRLKTVKLGPPILDNQVYMTSIPMATTSHLLKFGRQKAELSLLQRMQIYWLPSFVPAFGFRLEVNAPRFLQVGNPSPISFQVRLAPDPGTTSKSILGMEQTATLIDLELKLETYAFIKCETTISPPDIASWKITETNLGVKELLSFTQKSIEIPCTGKSGPVDIGKAIELRIRSGSDFDPSGFKGSYHFETLNIKILQKFAWRIQFMIQGEMVEAKSDQFAIVYPISGDVMHEVP